MGPAPSSPPSAAPTIASGGSVSNISKLWPELAGLGLSCGFATLSAIGVAGGVATEIPTGGFSSVIVFCSWTGMVTSSIQASNAVMRVATILMHPNDDTLAGLDQIDTYTDFIFRVDALGIGVGLGSIGFAGATLRAVLQRRGLLKSVEELRKLPMAEAKKEVQKALQLASKTDAGKKELEQALKAAGVERKANQAANAIAHGVTSRHKSKLVMEGLNAVTAKRLNDAVRDIVAGAGAIAASGTSAAYVGSASGSVRYVLVHHLRLARDDE